MESRRIIGFERKNSATIAAIIQEIVFRAEKQKHNLRLIFFKPAPQQKMFLIGSVTDYAEIEHRPFRMFRPQLIREALLRLESRAPHKRIAQKYNSGPPV